MLFHMVAMVLLSMVAFSTIFLLVKILQQPIRIFEISGYWSHGEENACYHVKEHKKLGQKLMSKVTLHFVWGSFIGKTNSGRGYSRKTMHFLFLPSAFIFPAARLVKVVFLLLFLYRRHLSTFHYLRPQFIWNRLKTLKWPSDMPKSRYWSGPTSILPLAPEYFNCG